MLVVLLVVVVVVVVVARSPPVLLLLVLFLTLRAALHGVRVGVGQQRGGHLLQGGVRGFDLDAGFAQQVDGVRQSGEDELETLLQEDGKL